MPVRRWWLACAILGTVLTSCQKAPRPLVAGTDACDYCRMTVSDTRFGGELQSETGRIHTFDAIECLASFYLGAVERGGVRAAWVTDFETGRFVPVDSATFLRDGTLKSPMGRALVAFGPGASAAAEQKYGGHAITWADVLEMMRVRGLQPGATPHDTAPLTSGGGNRQ